MSKVFKLRIVTNEMLDVAGVPQSLHSCTISKIPNRASYKEDVITYCNQLQKAKRDGIGLVLSGDFRTGKSAIAADILRSAFTLRMTGMFVSTLHLVDFLFENRETDAGLGLHFKEEVMRCDMLVLDDVGAGRVTDVGTEQLEKVIRNRIMDNKIVIITTNLGEDKFKDHVGKGTAALVFAKCRWIKVSTVDWSLRERELVNDLFDKKGRV